MQRIFAATLEDTYHRSYQKARTIHYQELQMVIRFGWEAKSCQIREVGGGWTTGHGHTRTNNLSNPLIIQSVWHNAAYIGQAGLALRPVSLSVPAVPL